jgi:hypothetical protein
LVYFTVIWYILLPFDMFMAIWYNFSISGKLCQEKSGNPVSMYQSDSYWTFPVAVTRFPCPKSAAVTLAGVRWRARAQLSFPERRHRNLRTRRKEDVSSKIDDFSCKGKFRSPS